MKNLNLATILCVSLFLISSLAVAQAPSAPPATPIDGGLSLLLLAGGAYGIKRLRKK